MRFTSHKLMPSLKVTVRKCRSVEEGFSFIADLSAQVDQIACAGGVFWRYLPCENDFANSNPLAYGALWLVTCYVNGDQQTG
jgi:hypothetical protein